MTIEPEQASAGPAEPERETPEIAMALESWKLAQLYLQVLRQNQKLIADSSALLQRHMAQ